jgi:hypothetical protein
MNRMSEEQKEAQGFVDEWAEAIADLKTPGDFNQLLEDLRKAPKAVQALAAKKAKELGFQYDKKTDQYTEPVHAS